MILVRRTARHAAPKRPRRRASKVVVALATVAATLPVAVTSPAPAQAADACTTPQLSDVMVSQGLPSYGLLARGKTTLVKLFLNAPGCLPVGATVQVSSAQLTVSSTQNPVLLSASLPLPPLGPPSTSPVAGSASDVLFVVPGSALEPATERVTFAAKVDYIVSTAAGSVKDTITFATYPGTTAALSAPVAKDALPFGLLVVPMGDGRRSADSQYPDAARTALESGMTAFRRAMPLADEGQLQWSLSPGLVDVSRYLGSNGLYCGRATDFISSISTDLEARRTAWNSIGTNTRAHVAFGQIWQGVSQGPSTDGSSCLEGAAWVPGNTGWGRTIATSRNANGAPLTGSIATMEVAHSTGNVHAADDRHDGTSHSLNQQADGTAPDRGYNLETHSWIADDRSAEHYTPTGWHDLNTLLEKEDWDWVHCATLPSLPANKVFSPSCKPGRLTWAGAGVPGQGTFVVSGSTDGSPSGTTVHSYYSEDNRYDQPSPESEYRFVQRADSGAVLADTGVQVAFRYSGHGSEAHNSGGTSAVGSFGAAVLDASTPLAPVRRIELWRGAPGAAGSSKLYEVTRDAPPSFLSVDAAGANLTVSATDERPQDLRMDVFVECPNSTAPLSTANRPRVVGNAAVFVTTADTSIACPGGVLRVRVSDGFSTATRRSTQTAPGLQEAIAAIYSPAESSTVTSFASLVLSGAGRDTDGADASRLVWSLRSGSSGEVEVAEGSSSVVVPPAGGFAPGEHTVVLRAYDADGSLLDEASRTLTVLLDSDGDGLADVDEGRAKSPCFAADAASDPRNALLDSDLDGVANIDDAAPCTSLNNVQVSFNPVSLYKSSSGQTVTMYLTSSHVDLRQLQKRDIYITQVAGYSTTRLAGSATALPAVAWEVTDSGTATAKFDRSSLVQAISRQPNLLGYVPVFVGTLDRSLRGTDPAAPHVFP